MDELILEDQIASLANKPVDELKNPNSSTGNVTGAPGDEDSQIKNRSKSPILLNQQRASVNQSNEKQTGTRTGYYIVLGSFKDPANAVKMKNTMDKMYETTIISRNKWGFDRVGYFVSSGKSEAQNELNYVMSNHPEAWIMYHSSN